MTDLACHFCRERRDDLAQSPTDPSMWWCPPGDVECNFRARRRLGLPLVVALEAKARELEQLGQEAGTPYVARAAGTRHRIGLILAGEPPQRTAEYRAHLGSAKWNEFSGEQKLLARHRCEGCGHSVPDLECHHLDYLRFGSERPDDIVVVCGSCHPRWDEARKAFYREHEYAATVPAGAVYAALLTAEVRDRIAERLERAVATTAEALPA